MLKRWTIENFKSFCGRAEFSLSPITVLAGANSSGKSTVIQGLLLAKQTIQHGATQRSVALNGPILRLGRFDDIHNVTSTVSHFGFGGTLTDGSEIRDFVIIPQWMLGDISQSVDVPEEMSLHSTFHVTSTNETDEIPRLYPSLKSCEVTFFSEEEHFDYDPDDDESGHFTFVNHRTLKFEISSVQPSAKLRSHNIPSDHRSYEELLKYDILEIDEGTQSTTLALPEAEILGCGARQFFPGRIAVSYDRATWKAERIADAIVRYPRRISSEFNEETIPYQVVEAIKNRLKEAPQQLRFQEEFLPRRPGQPYQLGEVLGALRRVSRRPLPGRRGLFGSFVDLEQLNNTIVSTLSKTYASETGIFAREPKDFRSVENHFRDFFANSVKYLGPLRDEPKPLYPLESLANTTDVGFKGEHTAAVLDLNRDRLVTSIDVDKFEKEQKYQAARRPLGAAVSGWLSYLGVAESVVTTDRGKIGHELQVNTAEIDKSHDLTNVGVGVSQVLPIVVMALLGQRGSLLIFEQPELHLHPKVQARLGDFFLAMSLLGKQCIVETHSEYLIERFRRRIAEDESDLYAQLISVYFFEMQDGQTQFRNVKINEYGSILDWPADFFDQAGNETEHIITAAATKRAQRKSQNQ